MHQQLGEVKECLRKKHIYPTVRQGTNRKIAMAAHRNTAHVYLKPTDHPVLSQVTANPTLRIMVFCATEGQGLQDIAYPHNSELKVNGKEIKANLRGLKNKPGSTRPVDITKDLRLDNAAYNHDIEMTYALTTKGSLDPQVSFHTPIQKLPLLPIAVLALRQTSKEIIC